MKINLGVALLLMSVVAFLLHVIWEYAQCMPFFIHEGIPPTHGAML